MKRRSLYSPQVAEPGGGGAPPAANIPSPQRARHGAVPARGAERGEEPGDGTDQTAAYRGPAPAGRGARNDADGAQQPVGAAGIEGGADTLIEALLAAIGRRARLPCPPWRGRGSLTSRPPVERWERHQGPFTTIPVTRSFHPTHSACAIVAHYLLRDSLAPSTAIGTETPWGRLSRLDRGLCAPARCRPGPQHAHALPGGGGGVCVRPT